jgi:Rrf2 family protein
MQVSARTDYALRAMLAVADAPGRVTAAALARGQQMPLSFLHDILADLRREGLLHSQRGGEGGYVLTRSAADITVGDVVRAVNGSLTTIRGQPTRTAAYPPAAAGLRDVWLAVHDRIAEILDRIALADLVTPPPVAPVLVTPPQSPARP